VKTYSAPHGFREGLASGGDVYVESNGIRSRLRHRVRHSPTGLSWGYGGSGPADTALSILWDLLGAAPAPWLYQAFKDDTVAKWPQDTGWSITEAEIRGWLAIVELTYPSRSLLEGEA
jgi:hypothetical protein